MYCWEFTCCLLVFPNRWLSCTQPNRRPLLWDAPSLFSHNSHPTEQWWNLGVRFHRILCIQRPWEEIRFCLWARILLCQITCYGIWFFIGGPTGNHRLFAYQNYLALADNSHSFPRNGASGLWRGPCLCLIFLFALVSILFPPGVLCFYFFYLFLCFFMLSYFYLTLIFLQSYSALSFFSPLSPIPRSLIIS